jgi:hypothetical protein
MAMFEGGISPKYVYGSKIVTSILFDQYGCVFSKIHGQKEKPQENLNGKRRHR